MTQKVIEALAFLTLVSNLALAGYIVLRLASRWFGPLAKPTTWIEKIVGKYGLRAAFIVALTATLGSLYFSEVAHFAPCELCWFQRVCMYPLTLMLGSALLRGKRDVGFYVVPLALVGSIIAAYHYYLQNNPNPLAPCSTVGFSVSCTQNYFTYYGYITIPWMALSGFILIIMALVVGNRHTN